MRPNPETIKAELEANRATFLGNLSNKTSIPGNNAQDSSNLPVQQQPVPVVDPARKAEYLGYAAMLVDTVCETVCPGYGITKPERDQLADRVATVACKYFPNGLDQQPEVMLFIDVSVMVGARVLAGVPMRPEPTKGQVLETEEFLKNDAPAEKYTGNFKEVN